jgi:hypothetical protein
MSIPIDVVGPVTAEVFTVARTDDELVLTGPCGADPWMIESGAGEHPLDTVRRIATDVLTEVLLVHSTSWRYERNSVVLSFVVVIPPEAIGRMDFVPIRRADLARSTAHEAPDEIGPWQVIEHALRHIAWLATEDEIVKATLDEGWHTVLDGYVPEPFRQLG